MRYCGECGAVLPDGVKFCTECGAPVTRNADGHMGREGIYEQSAAEHSTGRQGAGGNSAAGQSKSAGRKGTAGNSTDSEAGKRDLHLCPACGQALKSLTAVCPACGYEFTDMEVDSSLQAFVDQLEEYDRRIAHAPSALKKVTGWKSWGTGIRILWVLLNIGLFALPLIGYLAVRWSLALIRFAAAFLREHFSAPQLTGDERAKAALIERFPFPSEREALLEALLFTKERTAFLSTERPTKKNIYWMTLWCTKGEQLHQRAQILLRSEPVAQSAYQEIRQYKAMLDKKWRREVAAGAVIAAVCLVLLVLYIR